MKTAMSLVAKTGQTEHEVILPSGRVFRPLGEHFMASIIPLPKPSSVLASPEGFTGAPLGKDRNKPIVWGKVLGIGPKVKNLKPGDVVFIHPLNTNERTIDDISYYIPREAAVYCVVDG